MVNLQKTAAEPGYRMIGGDGREYGPATEAEVAAWIRDGRAAARTLVCREGESAWRPAAEHPEFREALEAAQPPSAPAAAALVSVGFWQRLGAHLLDSILLNLVVSPFIQLKPEDLQNVPLLVKALLVGVLVAAVYSVLMTGRFGATLGKMAVGARIVRVDGSPLGYRAALGRHLATLLSGCTFGAGHLMIAFREDKRALHDLLAGTRVVYGRVSG